MYYYIDEKIAVAEDTIIAYAGTASEVVIPAKTVDGHLIQTIGDGAYSKNSRINKVVIQDGIQFINKDVFFDNEYMNELHIPPSLTRIGWKNPHCFGCKGLKKIYLNIRMDQDKYSLLERASKMCNDNTYVVRDHSVQPLGEYLYMLRIDSNIRWERQFVDDRVKNLFFSYGENEPISKIIHMEELSAGDEMRIIKNMIYNEDERIYNDVTEDWNDDCLRNHIDISLKKNALVTFNPNENEIVRGRVIVHFTVDCGYVFWQSIVPVVYKGNTYYVYLRNYLNERDEFEYIKRIENVLNGEGKPVLNTKVTNDIIKKFRLLTLI